MRTKHSSEQALASDECCVPDLQICLQVANAVHSTTRERFQSLLNRGMLLGPARRRAGISLIAAIGIVMTNLPSGKP